MAASIITPAVVWFLITYNYFGYGYQIAFMLGSILFILWAFIWAVSSDTSQSEPFDIVNVFKKSLAVKDIKRSLTTYSLTSFSFSNSVIEVLIPIILFSYIAVEFEVGSLISFFAIMSIVASYLFWKFVSYRFYKKTIFVLGTLYAFSLSGFVLFTQIEYLVVFSTAITVVAHLFSLPQKVISDNVLHKLDGYKTMRAEYMVIREWFQAVWWIGSFIIIYFIWSISPQSVQIIFSCMILCVILCSISLSRVDISES